MGQILITTKFESAGVMHTATVLLRGELHLRVTAPPDDTDGVDLEGTVLLLAAGPEVLDIDLPEEGLEALHTALEKALGRAAARLVVAP